MVNNVMEIVKDKNEYNNTAITVKKYIKFILGLRLHIINIKLGILF